MDSGSVAHENILAVEKDYSRVRSNVEKYLSAWLDLFAHKPQDVLYRHGER